ncbi:hypothetical protein JR316_0013448 [Psilocybe cubensis]|uniref:Uncharacterized protein n=2 Tax=Psilocybe cubensis TaxID=181762 RepID=A0ACB8GFT5_PSICU|nr:uncharacterized protein JR316_0013448 [Psilocybe cubensis]KAH9474285.1 hypothetical protein JR316_0013448 [Psilocybe cubensis]
MHTPFNLHSRSANVTQSVSPIWKLSEDLLWRIFMTNVNNPQILTPYQYNVKDHTPRPLEVTRITSQVCRHWRNIILSSTAIWGRLIDFVSFDQKTTHWRDEVISRSGSSSLLWVVEGETSNYVGAPKATESRAFLLRFIADQWNRIEKIFVNRWSGEDWSFLSRPAPCLSQFEIHTMFDAGASDHPSSLPGNIFADQAPQLKSFQMTGAHCDLSLGWTANLQDLTLGGSFSNQAVFEILSNLPLLQSLDLYGHIAVPDFEPPIVYLPHLQTLYIDTCLEYLRHIRPPPGCLFRFRENRDKILSRLSRERELSEMYQNYFAAHHPSSLSLMCTKRRFVLHSGIFEGLARDTPDMELNFTSHAGIAINSVTYLFQMCSSPLLKEVTRLSMKILHPRPGLLVALKKFSFMLQSLDYLQLDEDTLNILLHWDQESPCSGIVFPRLQNLKLSHLSHASEIEGGVSTESRLERFLFHRRQIGAPIKVLDLTHYQDLAVWLLDATRSLERLDELKGMKVLYRSVDTPGVILHYECGSGHPDVLRLRYGADIARELSDSMVLNLPYID